MAYSVKEIYTTLQGEGFHTGRAAVFLRFAGCNLWTGRNEDRPNAVCTFCDTDFVGTDGPGGGKFKAADDLAERVLEIWNDSTWKAPIPSPTSARTSSPTSARNGSPQNAPTLEGLDFAAPSAQASPFVVCTGGEPLLQMDDALIAALHAKGCEIAVETNGTILAPAGIDWICVSPKADAPLVQRSGHELKLVYYQELAPPEHFEGLDFEHFFLQPMDGPDLERHTAEATRYCMARPTWRLSIQTHKLLGIP